jgi:guanylate kinase
LNGVSDDTRAGRLVILSGPSCVGKSPLRKAMARLFPELHRRLELVVLHNSRPPRPGERDGRDYHFRAREQIDALRGVERYVVIDARGDLQALDLEELGRILGRGDALFEGNPFVARALQTHARLETVARLGIFLSPLSRAELQFLKAQPDVSLPALVGDVMRRKLLRRMRRQKGELSLRDLEEVERRAGSAYSELRYAHHFEHVIPNHDGEDSENWDAFYHPLGDARKALLAVVALLEGRVPEGVESWGEDLLPPA